MRRRVFRVYRSSCCGFCVERRAREREIKVSWEMGESRVVGRGGGSSLLLVVGFEELRRGESDGRSEIAERICGVVVRRTIG